MRAEFYQQLAALYWKTAGRYEDNPEGYMRTKRLASEAYAQARALMEKKSK